MRVTEADNPLTLGIDRVDTTTALDLLCAVEGQLFGAEVWGPGLFEPDFLGRLRELRTQIQRDLAAGGRLVIGGAGTSGRLALQTQARHRDKGQVLGLLAGGVDAFFRAREGAEDSAELGRADLERVMGDGPLTYLGVSCGLSAAYVAGQAYCALNRPNTTVAILGFNAAEVANRRALPYLPDGFASLLELVDAQANGVLLNPIVGPEAISGSTRLKGGSATRAIIDYLLGDEPDPRAWFETAAALQRCLSAALPGLTPLVEQVQGAVLKGAGALYVAGADTGLIALLDATELPPTFGTSPDLVGCVVPPAIADLLPGLALEPMSPAKLVTPAKGRQLLALDDAGLALVPAAQRAQTLSLDLPSSCKRALAKLPPDRRAAFEDLLRKWWLNLFSTAVFLGCGKVFGNRMIDLRISNLKLWERAVRIVAELGGVKPEHAERALCEVVPGTAEATPEQRIRLAVAQERVVPAAILICHTGCGATQAQALLARYPKLADALRAEGA